MGKSGRSKLKSLLSIRTLVFLLGCLALPGPAQAADDTNPATHFDQLEQGLLAATALGLAFDVSAEGAITADLTGQLRISASDTIELEAEGEFAGQAVKLFLRAGKAELVLGNGDVKKTLARPARLREALLIGLTRMGILHNLAMLSGASMPDHAAGGVREWVLADDFAADPDNPGALSFAITVAGKPAGSAWLQIDETGLPQQRRQTVHFDSGEMRVVENYSANELPP